MRASPVCPRCGAPLHAPGLWSSEWRCDLHGGVAPRQPISAPSVEGITAVARTSRVPVWVPWPLPRGWVTTGTAYAGDARTGPCAVAVAATGPAPLGGLGEFVVVAEEPGVGMGAAYAGVPGLDPGKLADTGPDAKILAAGQHTPLWCVPGPEDRAVYVGEGLGCWLWLVLWPEAAGALLMDNLVLADARQLGAELGMLPLGALSPRLLSPRTETATAE